MCSAACIDEATNRVHIDMCIFSESIDISETLHCVRVGLSYFETTFRMYSRFPEACVSERPPEFSVPCSWFPEACWTEQHPEFVLLSSQVHSWESLVLTWAFRVSSNNLFPQIRRVGRRDDMLLLSPLANQVKSFPEIFSNISDWFRAERQGCLLEKVAAGKCGVVH